MQVFANTIIVKTNMSDENFELQLRAKHIRVTPQRLAILKIIHSAESHLSPGEVYDIAREILPGINEATVYRTLDFFYKRGLLLCAYTGESKFEYEIADPHHHLVCQKCDGTIIIDHQRLIDFFSQIEVETGFSIETHHLTFTGICGNCKKG